MRPEVLSSGELELEVFPLIGGAIGGLSVSGQHIFRKARSKEVLDCDPSLMGAFPMVPYCNRIKDGSFWFNGQFIQLEKDFDMQTNSIHGIGWKREWSVESRSSNELRISYKHDGKDWPWRFLSKQYFQLQPDRLVYELSVVNSDRSDMPAGLGLHPFFPESKHARVTAKFQGCWNCTDEGLPSEFSVLKQPDQFSGALTMSEIELDHVYVGLRSGIKVKWDSRPYSLNLVHTKDAHALVIYSPTKEDFFCIEPVSHLPNVINMGRSSGSMSILKPGDSLSMRIVFILIKE